MRHSIRRQIVAIADFSWWLRQQHIELQDLDSRILDRFLRLRRRQQRLGRGDSKTLQRMLALLREMGVVKCQPAVPHTARSKIIAEFQGYLSQDLGPVPFDT